MNEEQAREWLKIYQQADQPGTVVDWLAWLAESGYSLVQGPPTEPLPADDVWRMVFTSGDSQRQRIGTAQVQAQVWAAELDRESQRRSEHATAAGYATCVRCKRNVPRSKLWKLYEKAGGGLACAPKDWENYDACQRICNAGES